MSLHDHNMPPNSICQYILLFLWLFVVLKTFSIDSLRKNDIIKSRKAGGKQMNERLKKLRKTLDLTQQKFADRLGVKRNTVGQWECGINAITDQVVFSICREFDVNEEWLRTGEGEMFEQITEQQKLLKYTGMLLKDKDSAIVNAIQSFIVTYEQLDDTSKATLEKIAQQFVDNLKKSQ